MHRHLRSQCRAIVTLDEGGKCQRDADHEDGFCEACALTQPGLEEMVYARCCWPEGDSAAAENLAEKASFMNFCKFRRQCADQSSNARPTMTPLFAKA